VHVTTQAALFAAPKLASAGRSGMNFIARTGSVWTSSGTSRPIFPSARAMTTTFLRRTVVFPGRTAWPPTCEG
jgi:hypothetical protein